VRTQVRWFVIRLTIIGSIPLHACGGDGNGPEPIASIEVSPANDTLITIGQTKQFAAVAKDANGHAVTGTAFAWSSSSQAVAGVGPSGLVSAAGKGSASITATASGVSGSTQLVVQPMANVRFVTQPGTAEGQVPFSPTLRVVIQDDDGNTVTRATVNVTLTLAVNPGAARLVGDTSVAAVGGIATFANAAVSRPGDGFVLRATATGLLPDSSDAFAVHLTFATFSAGSARTCGVTVAGFAYCWGQGVGDSSFSNRSTPAAVAGGHRFSSVSAGTNHSCAITTLNAAFCWGDNGQGELGDGTNNGANLPVAVAGGILFDQISAGTLHTCGVSATHVAYCWGNNQHGELGDSIGMLRFAPNRVASGAVRFTQVSTGYEHTCGLSTDSIAYCWGDNFYGQLGDSTRSSRGAPTAVYTGLKFLQISAGQFHTCGLTINHAAYCWGWGGDGAVGDDSAALHVVPSAVSGGHSFDRISTGWTHSCGITPTGTAYCWGKNPNGAVGDSGNAPHFGPTLVAGGLAFTDVRGGNEFTCGLTATQGLYCWGMNLFGQVGDGIPGDRYAPARVVQ
jgi:alpha-tubulin suppressor-like RCC1 family protein